MREESKGEFITVCNFLSPMWERIKVRGLKAR